MNPFNVVKTEWAPGDQREVEDWRIEKQEASPTILIDAFIWQIKENGPSSAKFMRDDGRKFYVLECVA
jgi:hypothetical protein